MSLKSKIALISLLFVICAVGAVSLVAIPDPSMKVPEEPGTGMTVPGEIVTWFRHDVTCGDPLRSWRQKTFCSEGGIDQCSAKYCN